MKYVVNFHVKKENAQYEMEKCFYESENRLDEAIKRHIDFAKKYENTELSVTNIKNISEPYASMGYASREEWLYALSCVFNITFGCILVLDRVGKLDALIEATKKEKPDYEEQVKLFKPNFKEQPISLMEFKMIEDSGFHNTSSYKIEYGGKIFNGMVTGYGDDLEHTIWEPDNGVPVVYSWKGLFLDIPWSRLTKLMDSVIAGKHICTKCHKIIRGEFEQYFAGVYCKKCWTPDLESGRRSDYSCLD